MTEFNKFLCQFDKCEFKKPITIKAPIATLRVKASPFIQVFFDEHTPGLQSHQCKLTLEECCPEHCPLVVGGRADG